MEREKGEYVQEVKLDLIDRPMHVHRFNFDPESLRELADSIKSEGLHEPIIVRPRSGRFEIVAGDRRFLAHQILGRESIPALIRDMDDITCELARATENLQRVDLSPIEEAHVYSVLHEKEGMPIKEIARRLGRDIQTIKKRLALLLLPDEYQAEVHAGRLSVGVASELAVIDDPVMLKYYLEFAVRGGCTVKTAKEWVDHWKLTRGTVTYEDAEGNVVTHPVESVPTYVTCRCCQGPVEVRQTILLSVCPGCARMVMSQGGEGGG
jgi:ParB family chromosome partitioning protein